ncbi:MAG: hypothetical protein QW735_01105 [archaeon]
MAILIFIGGFLFFNSNMLQKKVISANFLSSISPGTSSVLEVKLFNPGEKKSIHLFVKADSPKVNISPSQQEDFFGGGETRLFRFTVSLAPDALKGSYAIDIFALELNESLRVYFEVA